MYRSGQVLIKLFEHLHNIATISYLSIVLVAQEASLRPYGLLCLWGGVRMCEFSNREIEIENAEPQKWGPNEQNSYFNSSVLLTSGQLTPLWPLQLRGVLNSWSFQFLRFSEPLHQIEYFGNFSFFYIFDSICLDALGIQILWSLTASNSISKSSRPKTKSSTSRMSSQSRGRSSFWQVLMFGSRKGHWLRQSVLGLNLRRKELQETLQSFKAEMFDWLI